MPKSKRDINKRYCAQAINHMSAALLDVNTLYVQFENVHPDDAKKLENIMLNINTVRDQYLAWIMEAFGCDEDQLMRYL